MKKTYRITVDCAKCASDMEWKINKLSDVKDASVSFILQKMIVEYKDGVDISAVFEKIVKICKRIDFKVNIEEIC